MKYWNEFCFVFSCNFDSKLKSQRSVHFATLSWSPLFLDILCAAKVFPLRQKKKKRYGLRLMDFLFASCLLPVFLSAAICWAKRTKTLILIMFVRPPKTKYENSELNGMSPLYICKSPEAESWDVHALYTGTRLRIPFLTSGFSFHVKYCKKEKRKKRKKSWRNTGFRLENNACVMDSVHFFSSYEFVSLIKLSQGFKFCCFCFLLYYL